MDKKRCRVCGLEKPYHEMVPLSHGKVKSLCRACSPTPLVDGEHVPLEERDGDRMDDLEKAIRGMRERGEPDGVLMEQCLAVWSRGVFPDGTEIRNENTRKDALKLLLGGIGGRSGRLDLRVDFVLDAKLTCSECGRRMKADPRVTTDSMRDMFDPSVGEE